MTAFWIAAAALTVVALVLMLLPLVRKSKDSTSTPARAEFDLTVYKDQLTEIARDMDRGVLSEDQALAARTEIERRMLAAAQDKDSGAEIAQTSHPKASMALIVAVLVAVPLGSVAFYLYLGQPDLADQPLAQRMEQMQNAQTGGQGSPDEHDRQRARELLAELEQRLKDNPKDIEGWLVLAQIYGAMNRYQDAVGAYEKVVGLTERHPEALTAMAESMIMAEDTVVIPAAVELLKEVKQKDPAEPRSYFYLALERQQKDDLQGAMDEYVALLKVSPSDAEWVEQIQARMEGLAAEMGIGIPVVEMLPPAGPPPGMADMAASGAPGPTQEQMREAQNMSPEEQQAMVQAMVDRLAEKLKDNPDDLAGWQRLAQAYRVLGDTNKVAEAEMQVQRLQNASVSSAPGPTQQQMREAQQMSEEDQQAMIQSMVDRLAAKLEANPDDLAGWQRLAQAYRVIGDSAGLSKAEAEIKRLQGQ